jgi:hypothetical protein
VVSSSSKVYIFTVHPAPLNIRVGGKGSTRSNSVMAKFTEHAF